MRKLKIEKDENDSLPVDYKEKMQIIFHKFMDLLIGNIFNNNNNNNNKLTTHNTYSSAKNNIG